LRVELVRGTSGYRAPGAAVVAAITLVALGLTVAWLGTSHQGPVICPFRAVTGLPCPTCGLVRTTAALLHGRIGEAVLTNPFDAFFLIIVVPVGIVFWSLNLAFGVAVRISSGRTERMVFWWTVVAVVAANWVYVLVTQL
jgi:hypothetical protein